MVAPATKATCDLMVGSSTRLLPRTMRLSGVAQLAACAFCAAAPPYLLVAGEGYGRNASRGVRAIDLRDPANRVDPRARTMWRVLVDHARARRRQKRGGDAVRVDLDDVAEMKG